MDLTCEGENTPCDDEENKVKISFYDLLLRVFFHDRGNLSIVRCGWGDILDNFSVFEFRAVRKLRLYSNLIFNSTE